MPSTSESFLTSEKRCPKRLAKLARRCDVLATTGGVSAGEQDYVVSAFGSNGGKLEVLNVAMRPGKPVKIGMIGPMLFAGLPGNPNAALVTFRQIALPAIRRIAGLCNARSGMVACGGWFHL